MAHMNFATLLLRPLFPSAKFIVREAIVPSFILSSHPNLVFVIKAAYKILYRLANVILCPSKDVLNELVELGIPASKTKLLYNPVHIHPVEKEPQTIRAELAITDDSIFFLASGRLHHQKGFDRLITHMTKLPGNWKLVILGDGDQKNKLQTLIDQNGLQDKILLLGHTSAPWQYYRAADYFLLPSRWEGLPNVVLEALAYGTPVIAVREAHGVNEIAQFCKNGEVKVLYDVAAMEKELCTLTRSTNVKINLLPDQFKEANVSAEFAQLL